MLLAEEQDMVERLVSRAAGKARRGRTRDRRVRSRRDHLGPDALRSAIERWPADLSARSRSAFAVDLAWSLDDERLVGLASFGLRQ
jgi:hypothetical protein